MRLFRIRRIILLAALFGPNGYAAGAEAALAAAETAPVARAAPRLAPCSPQRVGVASPARFMVMRDCPDTPEVVLLPGGSFQMGDGFGNGLAYERPVHAVQIAAFAIGRLEITVAQWQVCVSAGACRSIMLSDDVKGADRPMAQVSWDEAQDYVGWLSSRTRRTYRLPSEAEWEYAARAGAKDRYTWGNSVMAVCNYANAFDQSGHRVQRQWAWYEECDDGYATTSPVGHFPPSAWGVYDMLGNVWEWVADCWHADYTDAPKDGSPWIEGGDCSKRVNRGGGWGNNARALRVSSRDADPQDARSTGLGFRVAFTLPAKASSGSSPAPR